jgi:hypothetical protein
MSPLGFRKLVKMIRRQERGQVIVLAGFSAVMVIGFTALVTDVGIYMRDLRDAQNDADAAALAGARALMLTPPEADTAIQLAEEWATNNGAGGQVVWTGDGHCGTTPDGDPIPWGVSASNGGADPDTICLRIERSTPSVFARVLGIDSFPAKRAAAARAVHANLGAVCPWALKGDPDDTDHTDGTYMGVEMGKIYAVKVGAGSGGMGNFGILRLYAEGCSGGTACYKAVIESACAANGYNVVSHGEVIETSTEPGNVGNPTIDALNTLFGYELEGGGEFASCDVTMTWDEETEMGVPTGHDPRLAGAQTGCGMDAGGAGNGRYMLIPIVDGFPPSGTGPVQILAIANVYVTGWGQWDPDAYDRHGPPGQAKVYIEFVEKAPYKPKDLIGVSDDPLAPLRIILIR